MRLINSFLSRIYTVYLSYKYRDRLMIHKTSVLNRKQKL